MKSNIKFSSLAISFILLMILTLTSITSVFAWFNGQGYSGKTMSYSKNLHIGAVSSNITNFYGYADGLGNFIYTEIDPDIGFQQNSLVPGSYVHIRTDIENASTENDLYISIYLQDVVYDSPLNDYLYFGTNDPIIQKEGYKDFAVYDALTERYTLRSVPLITNYMIEASQSISLYWYLYIDSEAGMEIANTYIDLGVVAATYN